MLVWSDEETVDQIKLAIKPFFPFWDSRGKLYLKKCISSTMSHLAYRMGPGLAQMTCITEEGTMSHYGRRVSVEKAWLFTRPRIKGREEVGMKINSEWGKVLKPRPLMRRCWQNLLGSASAEAFKWAKPLNTSSWAWVLWIYSLLQSLKKMPWQYTIRAWGGQLPSSPRACQAKLWIAND